MLGADYSIEENAYWSERVYSHVFRLLNEYGVLMEGMLLKPNMCLPGRHPHSPHSLPLRPAHEYHAAVGTARMNLSLNIEKAPAG